MAEYKTGESLAATARAALLRAYMKKETAYSAELEEVVRWFAQNAPDHLQYQEYLRYSHQQHKEYLRFKRRPKTLLGKLFRRRSIT